MPCNNSRFSDYPFFDTADVQDYHYVGEHPPLYRTDCKFNYSFVDFTSNETIAGTQSKTDLPLQWRLFVFI
jgi:phosphoserine aminotransferase